ncbi:DUF190 domain-containing protein [Mycolicibacterium gilvum]|uniref:Uncharacterized conserved protein n=1 Tax=Mycolicibacterium gilvum (strain DSM 45189 / LMG 24558 / Spyr1) TaxID=278137 RepID=E6TLB6_MYCSR|nr:DUF190 domain-containing protein [Mycolicibacterium gilvum]ADU00401.1 uncharacterized conserved protein [Mycolicibacterium gilvum Spyr1]
MTDIVTLTAYFAERHRSGDGFLADAILDLCDERQIATSVMLRGIASFGPTQVIRSDRSLSLSEDPPVTVTAVDTAARIGSLAEQVSALVDRGVLTLERGRALPDGGRPDDTVRLSLHLGRRHRICGLPGYVAVCDLLHRHGFVGAQAYLGVDGTVAGRRCRARFFGRNADVPLTIMGVGTNAQAAAAVDELGNSLPEARFAVAPVAVCKNDGRDVQGPPAADSAFQALVVHADESSLSDGRPIHRALIERLKESDHASGATVLRAIWGFRAPGRPHGDRFIQLTRHVPVTTVMIDTASNIEATYPIVDELTRGEGLVTVSALTGMLEVHSGRRHGALDLGDSNPTQGG